MTPALSDASLRSLACLSALLHACLCASASLSVSVMRSLFNTLSCCVCLLLWPMYFVSINNLIAAWLVAYCCSNAWRGTAPWRAVSCFNDCQRLAHTCPWRQCCFCHVEWVSLDWFSYHAFTAVALRLMITQDTMGSIRQHS